MKELKHDNVNNSTNGYTCPKCGEQMHLTELHSDAGAIIFQIAENNTSVIAAFTLLTLAVCYAFIAAKQDIALEKTHLRAGLLNVLTTEGFISDDLNDYIKKAYVEFSYYLYYSLFNAPNRIFESNEIILDITREIAAVSYYHARELISSYLTPKDHLMSNPEALLPEEESTTQNRACMAAQEVVELMECRVKPSIYYKSQGAHEAVSYFVDMITANTSGEKLEFVDLINSASKEATKLKFNDIIYSDSKKATKLD